MAKVSFKSVDEYIASQPEAVQLALQRVRRAIRSAVPGGEESISYQIPTYKEHGRGLISYAGWKEHYALYPGARILETLGSELARYELRRGTIRFALDEPVPVKLIERIAKLRAREAAERDRKKHAAPKRR